MSIGARLQELREQRGLTLKQAAAVADTTRQSLSQIEKGQTQVPSGSKLEAWARFYGVTLSWLTTGKGVKDADTALDDGYRNITAYAQAAGLSDGEEVAEYQETHSLKFKASSLNRKHLQASSLAVIYGKGDSMLPRIHDGDAILFDRHDIKPRNETLFVIRFDGAGADAYSVKRCRKVGKIVMFESLNPQGDHNWREPRLMDDPRNPIEIIGRVRWIGSWED